MAIITRREFLRFTVLGTGVLAVGGIGWLKRLNTDLKRYSETRNMLGTVITIVVIDVNESRSAEIITAAFTEIERLSKVLSRHDPSSELSSLNAKGRLTHASIELVSVLQRARNFGEFTAGAFDVTVAPLVDLYKKHFAEYNAPPDPSAIAEAKSLVDYRMLAIQRRDIALLKPGMSVTLDGIAKGFIVDRTVDVLKAQGMPQVLVDAGGELSVSGEREDERPWRIGIKHPRALTGYYQVVEQRRGCFSTSGDYESAFTADYRFHHLIDPYSGTSPVELSSATVFARDSTTADALSVSLMVLGADQGMRLMKELPGVEALLIDKHMQCRRTDGFPAPV